MGGWKHGGIAVVGVLLGLVTAGDAVAAGARVRWAAGNGPGVAGYVVYVRRAGSPYASPIDVQLPAAAADGTLAFVVNGLTAGARYYFAVAAYATGGRQSPLSRELLLGAANPCQIDRCSSPTNCDIRPASDGALCDDGQFCDGLERCSGGVCQPGAAPNCSDLSACTIDSCNAALGRCVHQADAGCCRSDADCADSDACTMSERCVDGTCVSLATVCPEPPCTYAFCDPQDGCGTMPVADVETCAGTDLCVGQGLGLLARKVRIMRDEDVIKIDASGTFVTSSVVDPTLTGVTLEVADVTGAILYRDYLPGNVISARKGTRFRYYAPSDSLGSSGIASVVLKLRKGVWYVTIRARHPRLALTLGEERLTWALRFGDTCARQVDLDCQTSFGRFAVCR